jgi:hypothetical protein
MVKRSFLCSAAPSAHFATSQRKKNDDDDFFFSAFGLELQGREANSKTLEAFHKRPPGLENSKVPGEKTPKPRSFCQKS